MKQAVVFLRGVKSGILTEDENGYTFEYDANYLTSANAITRPAEFIEITFQQQVQKS